MYPHVRQKQRQVVAKALCIRFLINQPEGRMRCIVRRCSQAIKVVASELRKRCPSCSTMWSHLRVNQSSDTADISYVLMTCCHLLVRAFPFREGSYIRYITRHVISIEKRSSISCSQHALEDNVWTPFPIRGAARRTPKRPLVH